MAEDGQRHRFKQELLLLSEDIRSPPRVHDKITVTGGPSMRKRPPLRSRTSICPLPLMVIFPRLSSSIPGTCAASMSAATLDMLARPTSELDSIREAVLTVSPSTVYLGLIVPTTAAESGPGWKPTWAGRAGAGWGSESGRLRDAPQVRTRMPAAPSSAVHSSHENLCLCNLPAP